MRFLRRHLVPLLLMLPVVFVCGKLLLTPVNDDDLGFSGLHSLVLEYDRGWPLVFIHERDDQRNPADIPYPGVTVESFSLLALLGDFVVLVAMLYASWWILIWLQRRPGGWRQFSLRGLLILISLLAVGIGWWMHHVRQSRNDEILADEVRSKNKSIACGPELLAPGWLRRLIPTDYLSIFRYNTYWAYQASDQTDLPVELRDAIPRLVRLRGLKVSAAMGRMEWPLPQRIKNVAGLQQLEEIAFAHGVADDETLSILESLPNIRSLEIESCQITDKGLETIGRCKSVTKVTIHACPSVTAAGLSHLDHLTELSLLATEVDEATMNALLKIQSLEKIELVLPKMTDNLAQRLVELPNLKRISIQSIRSPLSYKTVRLLQSKIAEVEIHPLEVRIEPSQLPALVEPSSPTVN